MLKVFMSYASDDRSLVDPYFQKLQGAKFAPWMDHRSILPGADWSREILLAIERCEVMILFCSPRSVSKTGFVQAEARLAIEKLKYSPEEFITVIPAMLEPCEVPRHVRERVQIVDLTTDGAVDRLLQSLELAASQRKIAYEKGTIAGPFTVFTESLSKKRTEIPKYDLQIQYPSFMSTSNPSAADALSLVFAGEAHATLIDQLTEHDTEVGNEGDAWWNAMQTTYTQGFQVVFANNLFVSVLTMIDTYYRGAAHGNSHFKTWNFRLDGVTRSAPLQSLFTDEQAGLARLSELAIKGIEREYWKRVGERPDAEAMKWISEGAGAKWQNFRNFNLDDVGVTVHFSPYSVAAYVFSSFSICLSYFDLLEVLKPDGLHSKLAHPHC
ncbi:hypothetical protein ASD22_13510 [Rhodanobacter sp. Root480]|nr:hypothetical protein ASD22_13510 [Rhodanobacter sp. Root480]